MKHNYVLNMEALLSRSRSEREDILFDLVRRGLIDRRVCHMMLAELDMREEAENEDSEIAEMARRTPWVAVTEKKSCTCPECHGIGMRNVVVSTSFCQGNYRRADGSWHFEQDGTECEQKYEWRTCPDCHGTGKVM